MTTIVVIGGGIIGLCTAEKLLSEGYNVVLVEKNRIAAGASFGNAGGIAFSEVMPMASKAMVSQGIRWLFDKNGPFSVVPQDLPHTFSWLLRFTMAAREATYLKSVTLQSRLMDLGKEVLPQMLSRSRLQHMVRTTGALYLYDTKPQYEAAMSDWRIRKDQGVPHEFLIGNSLHQFQKGLAPGIYGGVYAPNYQAVTNPNDFCQEIFNHLSQNGLTTVFEKAGSIRSNERGVEVVLESGKTVKGSKAVVAAGPWSAELCNSLGDKVPLIGERGYNTTLPKEAFSALDKTFFFTAHGFVISPLADGVRVGGASEIAKLARKPNYRRSTAMLNKAKELVPALQLMNGKQWMGMRPTTPDTLPVIGRSSKSRDILYAFGHGHLGLTQSTATAHLIHNLVCENTIDPMLIGLSVDRF
jgi:D-amino-acid dehydrogenase